MQYPDFEELELEVSKEAFELLQWVDRGRQ
jgi:hypothetical protein